MRSLYLKLQFSFHSAAAQTWRYFSRPSLGLSLLYLSLLCCFLCKATRWVCHPFASQGPNCLKYLNVRRVTQGQHFIPPQGIATPSTAAQLGQGAPHQPGSCVCEIKNNETESTTLHPCGLGSMQEDCRDSGRNFLGILC